MNNVPLRVARSGRLLLVFVLCAQAAFARPRCATPCKDETARCRQTRCERLEGRARRACIQTCRGIGGCASIRTLAYVVTECRTDSPVVRQSLRIRRGNCAPVTVMEFERSLPPDLVPRGRRECRVFATNRHGQSSSLSGFFQRISVKPDGSGVAFEVTDAVSPPALKFFTLPPEVEPGFYFVRADGRSMRWLGPPSGVPRFTFNEELLSPARILPYPASDISSDGRTLVFTDWGSGPGGERAIQINTLDIASGARRKVTRLPDATPLHPRFSATEYPRFVDSDTILFASFANPDDLNPSGDYKYFTVDADGTGLRVVGTPAGSLTGHIVPNFVIAGGGTNLFNWPFPTVSNAQFQEVMILDGKRLLQLTDFRQITERRFLDRDRRRAFFVTTADPLGNNFGGHCQLFSVDTLGRDLRKVTDFREGTQFKNGCGPGPPPLGCNILDAVLDPMTRSVVFYSSCDPFGTNPFGAQVFAMRLDGTQLRQLTATRGRVEEGGAVSVELPGPIAYSGNSD